MMLHEPEVFESPDVENVLEQSSSEEESFISEHISRERLNTRELLGRLNKDLSFSQTKNQPETISEKCARLRQEIETLSSEDKTEAESLSLLLEEKLARNYPSTEGSFNELVQRLTASKFPTENVTNPSKENDSGAGIKYEIYSRENSTAKYSQLDERIAKLEKMCQHSTGNLSTIIQDLESQAALLDSKKMDSLLKKINSLDKENMTFVNMSEFSEILSLKSMLPSLIERLTAFKDIFFEGQTISETLQRLAADQAKAEKMLQEEKRIISQVKESLEKDNSVIISNFKSLQTRLDALEAKRSKK